MQKSWVRALTTGITLALMGMIFLFSTEPATDSDVTSGVFSEWIADRIQPEWRTWDEETAISFFNDIQYVVRKCAHFTEFALLGISLRICLESWLGKKKTLFLYSWSGGTLYAGLDELHQLLVDGRSGQWTDVIIDSLGVLCGGLLMTFILRCFVSLKKRNRE